MYLEILITIIVVVDKYDLSLYINYVYNVYSSNYNEKWD